jgi:hypothetical protein
LIFTFILRSNTTGNLVAYSNLSYGCLNSQNSYLQSYSYSGTFPYVSFYTTSFRYKTCQTDDCDSQAVGSCYSQELITDLYTYNSSNILNVNLTKIPIYQTCSSTNSPSLSLTVSIGLSVNQVYISDYGDLKSAASLEFIKNFTNFLSTAFTNNKPTSIQVLSLSSGSVIIKSDLVFTNTSLSSTGLSNHIQTSIQSADLTSFPVITSSIQIKSVITNCKS